MHCDCLSAAARSPAGCGPAAQHAEDGHCPKGAAAAIPKVTALCAAQNTIRTGGETVQAEEVEAALVQHPSILAAAVVGLPHPRWGEQVGCICSAAGLCQWPCVF